MPSLVCIIAPDSPLRGYAVGDVIAIVDADAGPGAKAMLMPGVLWVYATADEVAELQYLLEPTMSLPNAAGKRSVLAPRGYRVNPAGLETAAVFRGPNDPERVTLNRGQLIARLHQKTREEAGNEIRPQNSTLRAPRGNRD